ncbi:MAG: FAD-dependent oxidoreductase, partial [Halobacteria archaeon]|nr:FAD-dependent oxidoreductase [Halobacteria archaeon]
WRGKLRVLLEPLKKGAVEGETVRGFLSRKLGEEACDNCFAPLYSGIYGSDPDEMLYEYSLGRALEKAGISSDSMLVDLAKKALKRKHANLPPSCNFSEGIERLPRALYDENRSRVRLGTPVERTEGTDDGYVLVTDDHHVEVEHLVLTTPSDVAASLLEDVEGAEVSPLRSLNYNPIAVVHVDSDHDGDALGYQVRPDEDFETLGVTWNSSMFDDEERRGVFSCYLGGSDGQGTVEEDDETLGRIATTEFEGVTGTPATLLNVHRWNTRIRPLVESPRRASDPGRGTSVRQLRLTCRNTRKGEGGESEGGGDSRRGILNLLFSTFCPPTADTRGLRYVTKPSPELKLVRGLEQVYTC